MTTDAASAPASAAPMTPGKGLLLLLVVAVVVVSYIMLNHALGITQFWMGFLFLWYWASIEQFDSKRLPHSVIGMVAGLLLAWGSVALPSLLGNTGGIVALLLIVIAVYCQIMGWLGVMINAAAMLALTVGSVPVFAQSHGQMLTGLASGVVFFASLVLISKQVAALMQNRKAS